MWLLLTYYCYHQFCKRPLNSLQIGFRPVMRSGIALRENRVRERKRQRTNGREKKFPVSNHIHANDLKVGKGRYICTNRTKKKHANETRLTD